MKFVLGGSGSLGETPEEAAMQDFYGYGATPVPATPPSSPTSAGSIFGGLFSALTSPATVTATLNKYVFGNTAPIPTATNLPVRSVAPSSQIIAGVPNSYLLIGGAVALFLAMKGRR